LEAIKIKIGDIEYNLTSENKEILLEAANIVNQKIKEINRETKGKLNNETLSVLTSMNIAEILLKLQQTRKIELEKINKELSLLVEELKVALNN